MQRQPFNLETLKTMAVEYMEIAKKGLLATGEFPPVAVLVDAVDDTQDVIVPLPGEAMNDGNAKDKIADRIREEIRIHGYSGVFMMTDTFMLKVHPDKIKTWQFFKEVFGISNPDAAKMGFGELSERITCTAELVDGTGFVISLEYKRENGKVVSFGETITTDQPTDSIGRFRFFNLDEPSKLNEVK